MGRRGFCGLFELSGWFQRRIALGNVHARLSWVQILFPSHERKEDWEDGWKGEVLVYLIRRRCQKGRRYCRLDMASFVWVKKGWIMGSGRFLIGGLESQWPGAGTGLSLNLL